MPKTRDESRDCIMKGMSFWEFYFTIKGSFFWEGGGGGDKGYKLQTATLVYLDNGYIVNHLLLLNIG